MKTVTEFPHRIVEHADMGIIMSDGCRLSARVWMPEDAAENPVPVILEHLPYRKRDGTVARDACNHPWFAAHGYVVIRTDMRGNGDSEGLMHDEYTQEELDDAIEVINWAAAQAFCNGRVGMMGISWGGFNALQVAALQPAPLKAIITVCSTVDRYADDIHYKGGCLLGENFGWSSNMLAYSSRPPDSALRGDQWTAMWQTRLEQLDMLLSTWLKHQHRDAYWQHGSVCEDFASIKTAVLSIGGWHDGYRNTISHLVENVSAPVKGIVGPWIHKYPNYAKPEPAIGFLQEAKRWWDFYLKDIDTGVEQDPAYRAYLMDSISPVRWANKRNGRWIKETQWPSSSIDVRYYHLGQGLQLDSAAQKINETIESPLTCGATAGEYFPFAFSDELPDEQTPDDEGSCCFDSQVLEAPLDIVGAPSIQLSIRSDKPCAQLAVRLLDIRPNNQSALITYGVLNLNHHQSHASPVALTPNKNITFDLALDHIAYRLPAGHKLRVALSNAYWPLIWPSPERTTLTLSQGTLKLPVRTHAEQDEWQFEAPEGSAAWKATALREASYKRNVIKEATSGKVTTQIECDFGENRDDDHGLVSGSWLKETWSILPDDPLSATATTHWHHNGGRPGAYWRTDVTTSMTCTRTHFLFSAEVRAYLGDTVFFSKTFSDKVERNLV